MTRLAATGQLSASNGSRCGKPALVRELARSLAPPSAPSPGSQCGPRPEGPHPKVRCGRSMPTKSEHPGHRRAPSTATSAGSSPRYGETRIVRPATVAAIMVRIHGIASVTLVQQPRGARSSITERRRDRSHTQLTRSSGGLQPAVDAAHVRASHGTPWAARRVAQTGHGGLG